MISARHFGSSLRRHREGRNITLKSVEARTKISVSLLTALEKGDCSKWPAGIYSRSWVRAYAETVGLDPEVTVAKFAECFAETAFPDAPPPAPPQQGALRLGLAPEPTWQWHIVAERGAYLAIDLCLVVVLATVAWLVTRVSFVPAALVATCLVHMLAVIAGQGSVAAGVRHFVRAQRLAAAAKSREQANESPLVEAA